MASGAQDAPRFFVRATWRIQVTSKRDSSTACPGASRKSKSAGHSAQNDGASIASLKRTHAKILKGLREERLPVHLLLVEVAVEGHGNVADEDAAERRDSDFG